MPTRRSEPELHCELHDTRVESCRDRPEAGRAELCGWCAEIRGVQEIEHLEPQLDRAFASEADTPHHGEIDVAVSRSSHRIARSRSDRELIGRCERRCVEPVSGSPFVIG